MTDHELCLLAAKAAGYTVEDRGTWISHTVNGMTMPWSPIEDDCDAFRLMVDCRVDIEFDRYTVIAVSYCDREGVANYHHELRGTDKHAATRRAIVRAAAAMGVGDAPKH